MLKFDSNKSPDKCMIKNYFSYFLICESCIGVLGIQDICHFTYRDLGYYPFYFQGYGILWSIYTLLSGILNIFEN